MQKKYKTITLKEAEIRKLTLITREYIEIEYPLMERAIEDLKGKHIALVESESGISIARLKKEVDVLL